MNVKELIKITEDKIEIMVSSNDVDSAIKQIELLKSLRSIDDNKPVENEPKQGFMGVCGPNVGPNLAELLKQKQIQPRWNEVNQFPNYPYVKGVTWFSNNGPARLVDEDNSSVIGRFAFNNLY